MNARGERSHRLRSSVTSSATYAEPSAPRTRSTVSPTTNSITASSSVVPAAAQAGRLRSRGELIAENAFLRQQLIVASRGVKRPSFRDDERALLVLFARFLPGWRQAPLLVKSETLLRWHREGFRQELSHHSGRASRPAWRRRSCMRTLSYDEEFGARILRRRCVRSRVSYCLLERRGTPGREQLRRQ